MPRGDRTGPMGMGPLTGRRAGFCAGYAVPGYANVAPGVRGGIGYGLGGFGRGWRHRFFATGLPGWARYDAGWAVPFPGPQPTREQEMAWLKAHVADLQSALDQANARIQQLDSQTE